jgi:hypothetical protein
MLGHFGDRNTAGLFDQTSIEAKASAAEGAQRPANYKDVAVKKAGFGRIEMPTLLRRKRTERL